MSFIKIFLVVIQSLLKVFMPLMRAVALAPTKSQLFDSLYVYRYMLSNQWRV